jgi:hypothetical protein
MSTATDRATLGYIPCMKRYGTSTAGLSGSHRARPTTHCPRDTAGLAARRSQTRGRFLGPSGQPSIVPGRVRACLLPSPSGNREHTFEPLRDTHGVVGGPQGAAARLGAKRTTCQASTPCRAWHRPGRCGRGGEKRKICCQHTRGTEHMSNNTRTKRRREKTGARTDRGVAPATVF